MSRRRTAASLLIPLLAFVLLTSGRADAGPACEGLRPADLFPADGASVLPDEDLRYRDRGQMPERRDDPTSGLLFLEITAPGGGFTRIYAVPGEGGRWTRDHDSWFGPEGGRSDTLPPEFSRGAEAAGRLLVERLQDADCLAPPPGILRAYAYGPVRGAAGDGPTDPVMSQDMQRSPWAPGTPWAAAAIAVAILALWLLDARRGRRSGAPRSDAAWSLWAHVAAGGALVVLGCVDHRAGVDLSAVSPLVSWVHIPLFQVGPWWRLFAATLVLAGLLWPRRPWRSRQPGDRSRGGLSAGPRAGYLVGAVGASLGLFFLLRIRHELFGDAEFFRTILVEQDTPQNLSHRLYWVVWNLLAARAPRLTAGDALDLLRVISAAAGALYVLLVAHQLTSRAPAARATRISLVLVLAFPGIQVFFFYPEVYGLALVGHLLLMLAWTRAIGGGAPGGERRSAGWTPELLLLLAFNLAVECHTVALVMGPAVAWVVLTGIHRKLSGTATGESQRRVDGVLLLCGLVAARTLFILFEWLNSGPFMEARFLGSSVLPAPASAGWFVDRVSALLWVAWPVLVLIPATLGALVGSRGRALRVPIALAALPHLVYLGSWHCDLGVCRDWDLFAASGLVWLWLSGLAMSRLPDAHPARRRLVPLAVGIGAAWTLVFLLANAAPDGLIYP